MGTPTSPHPVLKKYYTHEGEKQPFVTALFDGAARYYDRVCGVGSLGSGQFYRHYVLRSEEHTSELQSQSNLVCRLLLEKKKYTRSSVIAFSLISRTHDPPSLRSRMQPLACRHKPL